MAVVKNWNQNVGLGCRNDFGAQFSNTNYSATLAANTATTLTVPTGSGIGKANDTTYNKFLAVFGYASGVSVFVANNGTGAKPAGGTFAATTSVLNPPCREVQSGDTLSFFSTAGGDVTVAFYSI